MVSLFTNVPFVHTTDIIINRLYDEHNNNSIPIPVDIFKKLMLFATPEIFMHNKRFYKQVEGIIIGNSLGRTMADFFMAYSEEKTFAEKSNAPLLSKFYIFDILMMCTRFSIATKIATSFFRF